MPNNNEQANEQELRRRFLAGLNRDTQALPQDQQAWREELAERALWEQTLLEEDIPLMLNIKKTPEHLKGDCFNVSTAIFEDERLSAGAVGMLVYILSMPDDWEPTVPALVAQGKSDATEVQALMAELQAAGYLRRERMRDPDTGLIRWMMNVYEDPEMPSQGLPDEED